METVYTVDHAKLNKTDIDILVQCGLGECTCGEECEEEDYSITDIAQLAQLFTEDATASVHHLILEGLLEWTDRPGAPAARAVRIPEAAYDWMDTHYDMLRAIAIMNDSTLFDESEIAIA